MYHFKECGLDYIWLCNGFERRETARGEVIKINDLKGLHAAIANWIVKNPEPLRGQEVKFLRSMLGISQDALGKVLRQSRATVARWEGSPTKAIPAASDSWFRVVYSKKINGDKGVGALIDLLMEIDDLVHSKPSFRKAQFRDNENGWKASAYSAQTMYRQAM
jgi:DNA-binding transcriptional regulator YiaG